MSDPDTSREDRLAEALRANLRRRKAASRKSRDADAQRGEARELKADPSASKGAPDS